MAFDRYPQPMSESVGVQSHHAALDLEGTDVSVRYLAAGEGSPVVLLHGIGLDSATVSWRHAMPALAADHRVYALDFPGHGESDKPDAPYTSEYYRAALAAFLRQHDLEEASLVGLSMGGGIALGHALESEMDPERLVLVDSYGLGGDAYWRPGASVALRTPFADGLFQGVGSSRAAVAESLRGLVGSTDLDPEFVEDVYEAVQDDRVGRALQRWQRSEFGFTGLKTDYSDRLGELDVPTLFAHGAEDSLLPASWSVEAAEATPGAELRIFEETGHWPPRERPDAFTSAIDGFLTRES
jgi:pimeloyl-ACP methyl ester carboxylesterase